MSRKQEHRAEETKRAILSAAGKLFAERGFNAVTMREIAKEAGCSHTTIYIYFTDKDSLLYQLSMPPLQELQFNLEKTWIQPDVSAEDKVKSISREFIRFCLLNRNMYMIFFGVKATRVDEETPELEINKLRNGLFGLLKRALHGCLQISQDDDQMLTYTRIYFFTLQGIVSTYTYSEETRDESLEMLMARLTSTFDEAFEVLLLGFKQKLLQKGAE